MATSAVAREVVFALRREIAKIEGTLPERLEVPAQPSDGEAAERWLVRRNGHAGGPQMLSTGSGTLDTALGGGLPLAGLTEIHGAETRDAGAVAGFVLALVAQGGLGTSAVRPVLWVATGEILSEAGAPYAPGLAQAYGIAPEALLLASAPKLEDALWVAEEAAALSSLSVVLLEMRGNPRKLDLTATRRLHRRALASGRPLFLLRQAAEAEPTAAPVRLVVSAAPAGERILLSGTLAGSIGPPAVSVTITRSRMARPAAVTLEWNDDDHRFRERQPAAVRTEGAGGVVSAPGDGAHHASPLRAELAPRSRRGGIAA